jgi:hypothetical protein
MGDYVFISYAREDHDFVLKLATELKDQGISVWLDQWDIPAGADWDQSIDSALHDCSQFLIILLTLRINFPEFPDICHHERQQNEQNTHHQESLPNHRSPLPNSLLAP